MTLPTLTSFFMWCTIINAAILLVWSLIFLVAPDFVYRTQSRWFAIPRATYNVLMWSFIGLFKLLFIVFSLVPYVALLIITG
jgi:hypothetical protein